MKNNRIGRYQIGVLTFFFARCFLITGFIPFILKTSGIDSLMSIILGTSIGLIFCFLITKFIKKQNNLNLIEIIDKYFPKFFQIILKILLFITFIIFSIFLLTKITLYVNNNYLPDIPLATISITFIITTAIMAKKGITAIARISEIIVGIFFLFFLLSIIGVTPILNPTSLKPFLSQEWIKIGSNSFLYGLTTTIPLFFLTLIPNINSIKQEKISKSIIIGYLLSALSIFLLFVLIIGTLGIDLASYYQYPETAILEKVSYFHFIERIEGILSIQMLLDITIVLPFILLQIKTIIDKIQNKKITNIVYYICLAIIFIFSIRTNLTIQQILFPLSIIFSTILLLVYLQLTFSKPKA